MLDAKKLLEPVRAILQRGSDGSVIQFGNSEYAEMRLLEDSIITAAIGVLVKGDTVVVVGTT